MTVKKVIPALLAILFLSLGGFAQAPIAHFTSDCKVLCLGAGNGIGVNQLTFTYNGTGGIPTSYSWTFPGGSPGTSTNKNPG